ncbi:MAG: hypothetical protein ACK5Z5_04335 [Neisseriaceae bacterium]
MKKFITILLSIYAKNIFALKDPANEIYQQTNAPEESRIISQNDQIIQQLYVQNPYLGMPSGSDTHKINEKTMKESGVLEKLLYNGNWNIYLGASYINQNGADNYGYGTNLYGQTGQLFGFSVGGLITIMNPFFSNQLHPSDPLYQSQTLPVSRQVTPQELFAQYQYRNIFQIDAGWIAISNSPWMTYYQNNALNLMTYQGVIINLNPGYGWTLTGFAINGAQFPGQNNFSQQTMYNYMPDYATATPNIGNLTSNGTIAMGASWNNSNNNLNFRIWGYQFEGYSNLLYADTTLKLPLNKDFAFTLNLQGALQGSNSNGNILNSNDYGDSVNSNMLGIQLEIDYKIVGLQLAYNNIWGPNNGYYNGNIISPYTYQIATDPLYTTGWMIGMIEKSAGQAYKIATPLNLLNNQLTIIPSYQYYSTTAIPASSEYDLQISYNIPKIKGLTVFAGYGYTIQPGENNSNTDNYQAQLMFNYLY